MAITFSIQLTAPQLDLLKKYYDLSMSQSKEHAGIGFNNFITHVRALFREGLLISYKDKEAPSGTKTIITRKGILMIKLFEQELKDLQQGKSLLGREMQDGRLASNTEIEHIWSWHKEEEEAARRGDTQQMKRLKSKQK